MSNVENISSEGGEIQPVVMHKKMRKIVHYIGDQIAQINLRVFLANVLLAPVPRFVGGHVRAVILRAVGFHIGRRSGFYGPPRIFGRGDISRLLKIGDYCWFNLDCHLDLSAPITIGNHVGIGPEVMILTGTHELGSEEDRVGKYIAMPVTIEDGVWIGARCTILPGVTIGRGAVIAAGTVVNRSVPPNMVVSGTQRMPINKWMALVQNGNQTASPAGVTE